MSGINNTNDEMCCNTNSPMIYIHELKIGDEFLKILRDNAFDGIDRGDVIDHIARVIEITEWIKIPDINKNRLRIHVFSKSLSNDAKKWWNEEIEGTTITSKFDNHWEIDKTTRCGLWEFYVNERTKGIIGDLHDEPLDESSNTTYSDWFYKPRLEAHEGSRICEIISKEGSPILGRARRDICDQDELCKTKEFTVTRYSMGLDKEFIAVEPSKISTVKGTTGNMSCIYHNLFNKRNNGWTVHRTK
ncbi:hypothetical protein Tco_1022430 [Tanacetum coccineum]